MNGKFKLSRDVRALVLAGLLAGSQSGWAYPTFTPEDQPVGWVAQPTVTSFSLTSGNETLYTPSYNRGDWRGNLFAYPISTLGVVDFANDRWSGGAGPLIDGLDYSSGRKIFTLKEDGTKIPFLWANLSNAQKDSINSNSTTGQNILNYVRGDRSNEDPNGAKFRKRGSVLGDILHSRPYYVPGTIPMVYVGANDGMLHAIRADTGTELYAYIPSMLIPKLKNLAPVAPTAYSHTHFVDASPNVGSVVIGGVNKKILVGGLGAGGKGFYALDVTNDATTPPATEAAAAAKILWEITPTKITGVNSSSYGNKLGFTYGVPLIGKANSGSGQSAVFAPNGYVSSTGTAVLFVIDATNGNLIRAIDTGSGSSGSPNGLSAITAIDSDFNGTIDYVYGGDLDGNLWKFDLTSTTSTVWNATKLFTTSPVQPIVSAPAVSLHSQGGYMINFATGALFTTADTSTTTTYYAYGIRDGGTGTLLVSQTLTDKTYSPPDHAVRVVTSNALNWTSDKGWKVPLPAGERVVGDSGFTAGGRYYFTSTNPTISLASPPSGENWLHELDYLTGGVTSLTPFFDLNGDLELDDADRIKDLSNNPIAGGAGVPVARKIATGVLSQPILVQLSNLNLTLFTQNPNVPPPPSTDDRGVSGGHFDFDIYYALGGLGNRKHVHEYDDKYDVTGVNMLNASLVDFNMSKVTSLTSSTQFKILVVNQYLNPAAKLKVGPGASYLDVKTYGGQTTTADAADMLAAQPVYTPATIANLVYNLPLDAFASKDWWGDGGAPRSGLMPTKTSCVNSISSTGVSGDPGPNGEIHNGALTIQIIRADTPASALELNYPAGGTKYGWRVKTGTDFKTYVHAEYTSFWHHPNGKCYGESGWVQNPPQDDESDAKGVTRAPGSEDPQDGVFDGDDGGTVSSSTTTTAGNVTTTTYYYTDDTQKTVKTTTNADGSKTVVTTNRDGTVTTSTISDGALVTGSDEAGARPRSGRISWREMYR